MLPVLVPAGDLRSADGSGERFDQHWCLRVRLEGNSREAHATPPNRSSCPSTCGSGLRKASPCTFASVCPVVATPVAEPRVAEGKVDADAMPAECVGHGHGCAGPAEWVKDDSRRGRRSGLRAGAGALSGDAVGQPCSRPGTCHSPAGQHLEAGRKSALKGRRCSARKLRTGASGCRRVSQIRVTERATWRTVDHSCPTVGAAVECHRRVLGRSARTLNGLAERP
jgi:hypothetical protein